MVRPPAPGPLGNSPAARIERANRGYLQAYRRNARLIAQAGEIAAAGVGVILVPTGAHTELGIAKGSAPTAQQAVDQAKIHVGTAVALLQAHMEACR